MNRGFVALEKESILWGCRRQLAGYQEGGRITNWALGPGPSWMGFQRSVVLFFLYVGLPFGFLLCWDMRELTRPRPVPSMCLRRAPWLSTLDVRHFPKAPRSPSALVVFPGVLGNGVFETLETLERLLFGGSCYSWGGLRDL